MSSPQDNIQLKHNILANQHEIFIVSIDEMNAIINASSDVIDENTQQEWSIIKEKVEFSASYYASADDIRTLVKLVSDLGSFGAQAYIKNYGGKPHIILKGHAGLRSVLTATKYGVANPKVVTLGLGKVGAINAAKSGGIISIVLISAFRVIDYFLTDSVTLNHLIGHLATDVLKIGMATGASIAAASAVMGFGVTIAVGPILAVIVVGVAVSYGLNELDKKYGITDRIISGLDEMTAKGSTYVERVKEEAKSSFYKSVDSIIDYAIKSIKRVIINSARHNLNDFLNNKPRVY